VAKLQAEIMAAHEIQRIKEVVAHQAQKEVSELKKKLEDAKRKAKDAASDLQAVVEGKPSSLPWADSACFARSWS
jgi:predicted transcriptional regulator